MKTIKAKVHMLPTEDKTDIGIAFNGLHYMSDILHRHHIAQYHHLYTTTDEEIKEGDWGTDGEYVFKITKCWSKPDAPKMYDGEGLDISISTDNARKIIATTDPKLTILDDKLLGVIQKYPQIPQSFIEEYCKAGGIDEVLVECKRIPHFDIEYSHNGLRTEKFNGVTYEDTNEPKLTPDNTIIIHPVEEKMIPLSKVKELCSKAFYDGARELTECKDVESWLSDEKNEWIEENL